MWSAAYGLVALAVVVFVVLYAAAHAPSFKTVNLADQLYNAKKWLAQYLPSVFKVYERERFRGHTNVAWVRWVGVTAYDYDTRRWVWFPVHLPLGYRLERARGDVIYQIHLEVASCRYVALLRGGPVVLYEVELMHSLDQLPWLEVYAAVPRNVTQYYSWLYNLYWTTREPPTVGLEPKVGADADAGLVEWTKVEWALVYDATSGTARLYAAAPPSALYIVVVDYPLAIPLACSPQ
jgi:hypothetical protein